MVLPGPLPSVPPLLPGGGPHIDAFLQREQRLLEPGRSVDAARKQFKIKGTRALEKQPDYLAGGWLGTGTCAVRARLCTWAVSCPNGLRTGGQAACG